MSSKKIQPERKPARNLIALYEIDCTNNIWYFHGAFDSFYEANRKADRIRKTITSQNIDLRFIEYIPRLTELR